MLILISISLIINVLLYKALSAKLKQIHQYKTLMDESLDWIDSVRSDIVSTYLKMKNVDDKGLFFKDDDVGFVFHELLELIKKLNDRIQ